LFVGGRIVRRKFNRYKSRFLNLSLMKLEPMEPRSGGRRQLSFAASAIAQSRNMTTFSRPAVALGQTRNVP
jgi:hypothetical protein